MNKTDKLIEEAMNAAIDWLNLSGQEHCRWGNEQGAKDAAALMRRAVDVRDEAVAASDGGEKHG